MEEVPQYVIKQNAGRIAVSQLIITFILASIFYLGIYINVALLGISIPFSVNVLIVVVLVLLSGIQGLLSYLQAAKVQYLVYSNRIQIEGAKPEYIMFNTIQQINHKKGFFDKIFNTGTLIINNKKLKAIPNFDQVFAYLNQVIQYSKTQYNAPVSV